ncbi:MAG: PSD1 and planctomycete cytochrome C domain-containing protein [Planctomycetota bacterium]|nr:PSD1 and planctomycete cytochrome C domain-containing protein [Planctomycetota bacterium]
MNLRLAALSAVALFVTHASLFAQAGDEVAPTGAEVEFFEKKIRPVLVEHCYQCHSADAQKNKKLKGGLLLDTRMGLRAGGESGLAIVLGKPGESLLLSALRGGGDATQMPPNGKLSDAVIADFETWIRSGAADPRDDAAKEVTSLDWKKARQFWAFQTPVKHATPKVHDAKWLRNDVDLFILAALERRGLKPVRSASKRELIRRATFDLTGLPPSIEEVEAFEKDGSPQAFEKVVDRLLKSPHYGERWGRYWLDVARYADDKALAFANPWPHAWRYRDWVVKAFNDDMPYDRFVRLQLAGDLLTEPKTDYTLRLAGLGFQGLGAVYHKGSVAEQVTADELDDRVDTLSRGLLGLTVACARCHDHKYDPIPTRDYYSLASAYNGAGWNEVAMAAPEVIAAYNEGQRRIKEQDDAIRTWLREISQREGQKQFAKISQYMQVAWRMHVLQANGVKTADDEVAKREKLHPYFVNRFREFLRPDKKGEALKRFPQLKAWFDHKAAGSADKKVAKYEDVIVSDALRQIAETLQGLAQTSLQKRDALDSEYEQALALAKTDADKKQVKRTPLGKEHEQFLKNIWLDAAGPLHADDANTERQLLSDEEKPRLLALRAELDQRKKAAPEKYPVAHGVTGGGSAMPIHVRGDVKRKSDSTHAGFLQVLGRPEGRVSSQRFTRLDLANEICSPKNPLTARVIVNRVWQHHFGRGIVASASNFGLVGDRPTHPELLDTLAVRFIESGWSLKWLHRELMLSSAYQLSSDQDTHNLADDPGNLLLWRFAPRRLDVESWRDAILAVSGRLDRTVGGPAVGSSVTTHVRRTLYGMVSRRDPDKMLIAFDFPDANVSSARRDVTTVPQQQLFVLNSDFMVQSAEALARRLEQAAPMNEQRITLAYQWAYARDPTVEEVQFNLKFLRVAAANRDGDKLSAWGQLAQAMLAANEFTWID